MSTDSKAGKAQRPMATYWRYPRIRRALLRWVRARNERKLKQALGWRKGWEWAQ